MIRLGLRGSEVAVSRRGLKPQFVLLCLAFVLGSASAAFAHEEEKNVPSLTLVREAIAIIRAQPELMDSVADKINDALESSDPKGVDLARVRQAQKALEAGNLSQTELLLEQAIGACPGQPVVTPAGIEAPPLNSPCPRPSHLTALNRVPVRGTSRPILLGLAVIAIAAGLVLTRRIR
jgi:hypothetical protein